MNLTRLYLDVIAQAQSGVLVYFIAVNGLYLALFVLSFFAILDYLRHLSYRDTAEIVRARVTPPISILVPAFNEERSILASLASLVRIEYPEYEIIVVNDGSKDGTLEALVSHCRLRKTKRIYHKILPTKDVRGIWVSQDPAFARLIVVDKENGGKADALNAGINVSRYPLFVSMDADSLLEKDALLRVCLPFLERFHETAAVGGIVRIANGCRIKDGVVEEVGLSPRWLPTFQVVEYLRAFLSGRMGWSEMNALLIISGAFGVYKKAPVVASGGYLVGTVGEDMELALRLHADLRRRRQRARITFIPDPVCWTEAPEHFASLWSQRERWHRGLGESLLRHKQMLFNPSFGAVGLLAAPYFWGVELLSPVVELAGYWVIGSTWMLGALDVAATSAFFLLTVLMGMLLSVYAVLLEEMSLHRYPKVRNLVKLIAAAVFENLGYRQFNLLARIAGLAGVVTKRTGWGALERHGALGPGAVR